MKNKFLVLGLALVGLATLAVGCNKPETTAAAVSTEAIKAPDQAADALNAANTQKAADSQKAAEDLKAAEAQKLRETTAQKQADADKADQALKQAAAQPAADKPSDPATGTSKVQAIVDSAKTLAGEKKWDQVLQVLAQLAGDKLSPAQQTVVDGLKSDAQKQLQADLAKKATSDAGGALGGLLDPKK